jgi:elongation factor G
MGNRAGGRRTGPKCIAIVGPFSSGKSTLLEAILARTGAIARQNPIASGNTVSDHSPEAREHAMSVEATFATVEFMGDTSPSSIAPVRSNSPSRPSPFWLPVIWQW